MNDTKPMTAPKIQPSLTLMSPIKSFCFKYVIINADKHSISIKKLNKLT